MSRSRSRTSASIPWAIQAALQPTLPAPMTTTRAGRTPGTPPSKMPRVPCEASRKCAPTWELHGLIGDAGCFGLEEGLCHARVSSEVEVGEQHQARPQVGELGLLGLFHLADHLSRPGGGGVDDGCSRSSEVTIAERGARAGSGFDENLVAEGSKLPDTVRGEGDTAFGRLYLRGDTDDHDRTPLCS